MILQEIVREVGETTTKHFSKKVKRNQNYIIEIFPRLSYSLLKEIA